MTVATAKTAEHLPGAVDAHVHIFDPSRFSYATPRAYTPGSASPAELLAHLARANLERAVIVQPSVYGTDNRCLVDALGRLGPKVARGVAVIDPATVSEPELRELAAAGVTGIRVNMHTSGPGAAASAIADVAAALRPAAAHNFAVQLYIDIALLETLEATIAASSVPVVLDHYAGARARDGLEQPGYMALRRLLDAGKVWVKLSALYRAGRAAPGYGDVAVLARSLIAANPDRLVWGSDWPHTGGGADRAQRKWDAIEPFRAVDNPGAVALVKAWAATRDLQTRIFVTNPQRLFRF